MRGVPCRLFQLDQCRGHVFPLRPWYAIWKSGSQLVPDCREIAGKYTNATGLTECFSCPAGTFSAGGENELLGAVRCDPCPKGTYQQLSGAWAPQCFANQDERLALCWAQGKPSAFLARGVPSRTSRALNIA